MRLLLLTTAILSIAAGSVYAADAVDKPAVISPSAAASTDYIPKDQWDKMTPEQKKKIHDERVAKREDWKKKYDAAGPAEQEKMRAERRAHWKERYDHASPEEKKRMDERHEKWVKEHGADAAPATPAAAATPAKK